MSEQLARGIGPAEIDIAYEEFGDATRPPVLLIMGGGAQMVWWPDGFCHALVSRGLRVIRFDSRDTGRSTHFTDAPPPDVRAALAGDVSSALYTLSAMAADTVGLMDHLGFDSAHLVGASLGGMVAQTVAIEYPHYVRSLTSMMSSTGDPAVGRADTRALAGLGAAPRERQAFIEWQVRAVHAVASPAFAFDHARLADVAARSWDRGHNPVSLQRHAVAALASGDRTDRLHTLRVPTLVIHGTADVMIDVSGGRATAAAIPDAELLVVEGLGHGIPEELWSGLATRISDLVLRADRPRPAAD